MCFQVGNNPSGRGVVFFQFRLIVVDMEQKASLRNLIPRWSGLKYQGKVASPLHRRLLSIGRALCRPAYGGVWSSTTRAE